MFILTGASCVVFTRATGFSGSGCYDSRRFFHNTPVLSIQKPFSRSRYNGRPAHWNQPHDNTVRPFRDKHRFAALFLAVSHKSPFLFSVYRQYMPKKGIYVSNSVNINSHGDRIVVRQPNLALFVLMDGKCAFDGGFIGENVINLAACLLAVAVIGGFLDGSR